MRVTIASARRKYLAAASSDLADLALSFSSAIFRSILCNCPKCLGTAPPSAPESPNWQNWSSHNGLNTGYLDPIRYATCPNGLAIVQSAHFAALDGVFVEVHSPISSRPLLARGTMGAGGRRPFSCGKSFVINHPEQSQVQRSATTWT